MRKNIEQKTGRRGREVVKVKPKIKEKKKILPKIELDKKKVIIIISIILVIGAIIIANNYTALGLVINKNITSEDAVQVELQTTNNKVFPFGNEVLVYNKGQIAFYNNYGKNTANIILEDVAEVDISTAGKYIQVINKDKGIVYVYKNKYEVARIKIDGTIYSGNINSEGTSVIEYSVTGNKMVLGIYDNSGNLKYNVKLNSNILGKYVLADNSKYLVYSDVDVTGISAHTNINLIELEDINENGTGINVTHSVDNTLVYDIYWDGKDVIARTDDEYILYNVSSSNKQSVKISNGQLLSIGDYSKKCAYIEQANDGDYILCIRNMLDEKTKNVPIEDIPKYFMYDNGVAYICYSKKIEAYNNFGMKIKTYDSDMVITEPIVFCNGRSVAMTISNKLIMFTI